jgi:hypothetical protein
LEGTGDRAGPKKNQKIKKKFENKKIKKKNWKKKLKFPSVKSKNLKF